MLIISMSLTTSKRLLLMPFLDGFGRGGVLPSWLTVAVVRFGHGKRPEFQVHLPNFAIDLPGISEAQVH